MADASDLRQRLVDGANRIMEDTARACIDELVESWNGVVKSHTGDPHLEDTSFAHQVGDEPRISWRIGFTAPQGDWMEHGVDPHGLGEIGTLRHWTDEAGEDIFRRYTGWEVSMPARPWFGVRLQEVWPDIVSAHADSAGW